MRSGRPTQRGYFRGQILRSLSTLQYPVTATTVKKIIEKKRNNRCSWNTVQKYLHDLCEDKMVYRQSLPTEPGRKPLVVYFLRQG